MVLLGTKRLVLPSDLRSATSAPAQCVCEVTHPAELLPAPCPPLYHSVAGCGVLRQVLLASPALAQFRAAGCSRLMVRRLCKRQSEMAFC